VPTANPAASANLVASPTSRATMPVIPVPRATGAAYPGQLTRALGTFSGVTGLAVLGGPVVGGAIAEGLA
jgi:hypothetical protein